MLGIEKRDVEKQMRDANVEGEEEWSWRHYRTQVCLHYEAHFGKLYHQQSPPHHSQC